VTEAYENLLRKSLDSVDRRQKWFKIIAIVFIVLGCGNAAMAMIYIQDMRLLYIATFAGLIWWTGGLAVAILGVTNRNTWLILRALALNARASENPSDTRPGSQS
jgi:hypothetical protein